MSADDPTVGTPSVAILGAGIAGLTTAYRLHQAGVAVRVLEAEDRCGGPMRTVRSSGCLFELGPNTVPSTAPHLGRLIDALGLRDRVQLSRPVAGRRLVWRKGRLHALPEKPPHLLTCSAIGLTAKLRLLAEPLVPARRGGEPETLLEFGQRRLGPGAVSAFLDPFITGVFAGRLDRLGVDALPRLAEWEDRHGSLFRAAIAEKKARTNGHTPTRPGPPPLISFPDGLETLPKTLAEILGRDLMTGCRATAIEDHDSGYRVRYIGRDGEPTELDVDGVVIATPARVTAELLRPHLPGDLLDHVEQIEHPFVATVGLAYRRDDVRHALEAFGVLIASDSRLPEEADVLGVLFPSSIFADRTPDGEVSLTVMVGGARDPGAEELDDEALISRARKAVHRMLGVEGEPTATELARWPQAIPQYGPGHAGRVAELRRHLADSHPRKPHLQRPHDQSSHGQSSHSQRPGGLVVAGNYLDGVGVEGAVASAETAAATILSQSSVSPNSASHPMEST